MVKNLNEYTPYQVNILELPEIILWKLIKGGADESVPAMVIMNHSHPAPEKSTQLFFARESCEVGDQIDWRVDTSKWRNPPALNLYWFRWVLSHHLIFLCWHRMVAAIFQNAYDQAKPLKTICTALIKFCSLMLLYAASCPNALYKKHIRTFMALYHRGFTAKWSLEYHAYKIALEKLLCGTSSKAIGEPLRFAYYEHNMVHMAVSKKFMGHAPSLLKMHTAANNSLGDLTSETQFVYDSFFLVKRVEIMSANISTMLIESFAEKMLQLQTDLHFNPLFPEDKIPKVFLKQKKIVTLLEDRQKVMEDGYRMFLETLHS